MLPTWFHTGMIAAGILAILPAVVRAEGPSDQCRGGASQCRDAFEKLESCQSKSGKKPDKADGEQTASKDKVAEEKPAADTCATERAATDAACKTTNSACVKDGSRHAPHARKG